jgi:DNA-binding NtrC family response regulator
VIAATNRDLRAEVNAGSFRQDLYYRIAVVLLRVPPLRDRTADLELLIEHFLGEAGFDGEPEEIIPPKAIEGLRAHHWPGNVRELRNFVEAALALGEPPALEEPSAPSAPAAPRPPSAPAIAAAGEPEGEDPSRTPYSEARAAVLSVFEQRYLRALMARTRGNVSLASRESKMNRQHLTRMLKRLGIK